MKRSLLPLCFLLCCTFGASAQDSTRLATFDWMVKTFAENDAGYPWVLKQKGEADLQRHTAECRRRVAQASTEKEYLDRLTEWLYYFRKGHIGISRKESADLTQAEKDSLTAERRNMERLPFDRKSFERYLQDQAGKTDPAEGIWTSKYNAAMGIVRSKQDSCRFKVFALRMSDSLYWQPGTKTMELLKRPDGSYVDTEDSGTHLTWPAGSQQILKNSRRNDWVKIYPKSVCSAKDSLYQEVLVGSRPFVKRLDAQTLYLRIPSFELARKPAVDALLARYDRLIRSTPNLILDIRNGTGGSDRTWVGLIPYFYTQPIRHPGMRFRAGPRNIERLENSGNKAMADRMKANPGGYVDMDGSIYTIRGLKPTAFPRKMAILCDRRNASSDESLLFMAKQSWKVKVYGQCTAGMLDFSNLNLIDFPDRRHVLWLAMSETVGHDKFSVDADGIQPDFFLPDSLPEQDWIDYVRKALEE